MHKKIYRSASDRKIAGVCGGIAQFFNIDSTLIRLAFALFVLMGGSGVLAYIICALIIPDEPQNGYQSYDGYQQGGSGSI